MNHTLDLMPHLWSKISYVTSRSRSPQCSRLTDISFFSWWSDRTRGSLTLTYLKLKSVQHAHVLLVLCEINVEWHFNLLLTLCPLGPMIPTAPSSPVAPWKAMIDRWLLRDGYCIVWQVTYCQLYVLMLQVAHGVQWSHGGPSDLSHPRLLCHLCLPSVLVVPKVD